MPSAVVDESAFEQTIEVRLNKRYIFGVLAGIISVLLLLNFGMQFRKFVIDPQSHVFLKLQVNSEGNVATFFSTLILLVSASLLFLIAFVKRQLAHRYRKHWMGLSFIFFYLALDEAAGIHEKFNRITQGVFHQKQGVFFLAWVIPFGILLLVFMASYVRFLVHLPVRSRLLFMLSGAIYVFGALVMEVIGGLYVQAEGDNLMFQVLLMIEEGMEMLGVSLFIFSLLDYLQQGFPKLDIQLQP